MWTLNLTTQFKKDLKRYQKNAPKLAALKEVLNQLQETGTVDPSHKPHHLSGLAPIRSCSSNKCAKVHFLRIIY